MLYAFLGILIYFFQNKTFDIKEDLGLVITITGVIVGVISFFLTESMITKKLARSTMSDDGNSTSSENAVIIVGRWMVIEKMLSKLVSAQTGVRVTSFNQIINYLNSDDFDQEIATSIINLLKTRNAVVHNQLEASNMLVKGYVVLAGNVIEKLEDYPIFK
jgi:hypothetical protein